MTHPSHPGEGPGATPDEHPTGTPGTQGNGYDTVEGLFGVIQHAIDKDADEVDVTYDEATGRPERIDIDWMTNAVDDEQGITVDSFTVLGGDEAPVTPDPSITLAPTTGTSLPASVQTVNGADLSVHHGCGTGFSVGNPEQTVALILTWQRADRPTTDVQLPEAGPVTLPDASWEGELRVGTELFANWCNDLIDRDDPVPEVAERWTVVGGTLELTAAPTPNNTCGSGRPIEATVTDLAVEAPDGTIVGLADLDLVNDAWGCFAG